MSAQRRIKIKVCGMRDTANIAGLVKAGPDYIGFILYPGSIRFVGHDYELSPGLLPASIQRVGVFVNELIPEIVKWINRLGLHMVQLHGKESPEYCRELSRMNIRVIKAFGIDEQFDFGILQEYEPWCEFFLFDTKTEKHGGSGEKFSWDILGNYTLSKPFFLSGGIGPEDAEMLRGLPPLPVYALDINSRFEKEPACKDIAAVGRFIKQLKTKNNKSSEISG